MTDYCLYILMRSDMNSLNPGKAMAQAAHAANQFMANAEFYRQMHPDSYEDYDLWKKQGTGFGTTIVLDIGSLYKLDELLTPEAVDRIIWGAVYDRTYPILDGDVVHTLPITTCGYLFLDRDNESHMDLVKELPLYD